MLYAAGAHTPRKGAGGGAVQARRDTGETGRRGEGVRVLRLPRAGFVRGAATPHARRHALLGRRPRRGVRGGGRVGGGGWHGGHGERRGWRLPGARCDGAARLSQTRGRARARARAHSVRTCIRRRDTDLPIYAYHSRADKTPTYSSCAAHRSKPSTRDRGRYVCTRTPHPVSPTHQPALARLPGWTLGRAWRCAASLSQLSGAVWTASQWPTARPPPCSAACRRVGLAGRAIADAVVVDVVVAGSDRRRSGIGERAHTIRAGCATSDSVAVAGDPPRGGSCLSLGSGRQGGCCSVRKLRRTGDGLRGACYSVRALRMHGRWEWELLISPCARCVASAGGIGKLAQCRFERHTRDDDYSSSGLAERSNGVDYS